MDNDTLRIAAHVLALYWRLQQLDDANMQFACYQLERALQDYLPKGSVGRLRRVSSTQIDRLSAAFTQLIGNPGVEALILSIAQTQRKTITSKSPHQTPSTKHLHANVAHPSVGISQTMHVTILAPPQPQTSNDLPEDSISLQLLARENNTVEIRVLRSPNRAEGSGTSSLPYTPAELVPVLKALAAESIGSTPFTTEQLAVLKNRGLLRSQGVDRRIHKLVGRALYDALFAGSVGEVLRATLNPNPSRRSLHLQLYFDEDDVELARFPWELIHDGFRPLVKDRVIHLTRYITYRDPPPPLRLSLPLDLVYVAPRPRANGRHLLPPNQDLAFIRKAFAEREHMEPANIRILSSPTRQALVRELQRRPAQIVHIDSHGSFARVCPRCGSRNQPHMLRCADATCREDLIDVAPEGLVAFEDEDGQEDWVSSEDLASMLSHRGVQLAVLLACVSGAVRGETLFTGLGPALIKSGIPMVIATQADISSEAAQVFSEGLYAAIAREEPLTTAAAAGRDLLQSGREWYVPVVYLRERR
jgi:hypothetical protein